MIAFSIVVPTNNRPHLLKRALDSALLAMTDADEILIVNDGSTVSYDEVLSSYTDARVKYFSIPHAGVSAARNYGLEKAGNNFIAFLDDDDEWYVDHLNYHRTIYRQYTDLAGIFSNFDNTNNKGELLPDGLSRWAPNGPKLSQLLAAVPVDNMIGNVKVFRGSQYRNQLSIDYILPSTLSINTGVVGNANRFKVGLHRNESWLFSSRICAIGEIAYIDVSSAIQHGDADHRLTDLSDFDTVLSRLLVMREEWGANHAFLRDHRELFETTFLMDFVVALGIALRRLSARQVGQLFRQVGYGKALKLALQAVPYFLNTRKLVRRTT